MNVFAETCSPRSIAFGEASRFCGKIVVKVFNGRVLKFIGETVRQAGILITGSAVIVLGLVFILGLQCGIEGAYAAKSVGATSATGAITALCDLREVIPYAFGYMMAAKVGHRVRGRDRLDADLRRDRRARGDGLRLDPVPRLDAAARHVAGAAVPVHDLRSRSGSSPPIWRSWSSSARSRPGGYLQLFWQFQAPTDFLFYAGIKCMAMATFIVLVCVYYGYHVSGGPVGVGKATAQSMVANILGVHLIGMVGTQLFWGGNARAPIGG